jgi:multidrug efflux pump subunit AcrA (membrane-fusion protein)
MCCAGAATAAAAAGIPYAAFPAVTLFMLSAYGFSLQDFQGRLAQAQASLDMLRIARGDRPLPAPGKGQKYLAAGDTMTITTTVDGKTASATIIAHSSCVLELLK